METGFSNNSDANAIGIPSVFDGKRLRKKIQRKTVDYFNSVMRYIENRPWKKDHLLESCSILSDFNHYFHLQPPIGFPSQPANALCTKFVHSSYNKNRHPINVCKFFPDGKRLITGLSSGEFTLWNALTFNFETILQAHDQAIRTMIWSHDNKWMLSSDDSGVVKYWQPNMNNVKEFQAHDSSVREASFAPTDIKFVTGADDKKIKIFDFKTCQEERVLEGHRSEIRCVDWHPFIGLVASGGKDKLVKLWEPRSGQIIHTIKDHKNYVLKVKFNQNGNWFITACGDLLIHMFDIRMQKEVQVFCGHNKKPISLAWHPIHEKLFVSGSEKGDAVPEQGAIKYWIVGNGKNAASINKAHDGHVLSLDWHPLGHILCSSSNDHATKFWTRNRPGDKMRDKYNLDIGEEEEEVESGYENVETSFQLPGFSIGSKGNTNPFSTQTSSFNNPNFPSFNSNSLQTSNKFVHPNKESQPIKHRYSPNVFPRSNLNPIQNFNNNPRGFGPSSFIQPPFNVHPMNPQTYFQNNVGNPIDSNPANYNFFNGNQQYQHQNFINQRFIRPETRSIPFTPRMPCFEGNSLRREFPLNPNKRNN